MFSAVVAMPMLTDPLMTAQVCDRPQAGGSEATRLVLFLPIAVQFAPTGGLTIVRARLPGRRMFDPVLLR